MWIKKVYVFFSFQNDGNSKYNFPREKGLLIRHRITKVAYKQRLVSFCANTGKFNFPTEAALDIPLRGNTWRAAALPIHL